MPTLEELQRQLVQLKVKSAVHNARQKRLRGERDPAYDPTAGMSNLEKAAVGNTSQFGRGLKGLVNLALPDEITPEFASDAALAEQDQLDAPLMKTGAGRLGGLVGAVGSTLPIGGGTGTLAKLATGGGRVLKGALSTPVRGAVEGAIDAAAFANPEDRGQNAGVGAVLGGGLGGVASVLGRTGRGLGQRSKEVQDMEFLAAQHGEKPFTPVSHALGDDGDMISRVVKNAYKEGLPYVPGVSGQAQAQGRRSLESFRRAALSEADSTGTLTDPAAKSLTPAMLKNPVAAVEQLRKSVNDAYTSAVGGKKFTLQPWKVQAQTINAELRRSVKGIDPTTIREVTEESLDIVRRFTSGKLSIGGEAMLNAKNEVGDLIKRSSGVRKKALIEVKNMLDREVYRQLPKANGELYKRAGEAHMDVLGLEKAMQNTDEFSPLGLAKASPRKSGMRQFARTYGKVLRGAVGNPGAAGRNLGRIGTGAVGAVSGILPAAAIVGGANLAYRPGFQNFMMGNTGWQKALVEALNKDPQGRMFAGSALRAAATTQLE